MYMLKCLLIAGVIIEYHNYTIIVGILLVGQNIRGFRG